MDIPDRLPLFSLSVAARIANLPPKVISYFEKQKLLNPLKTPGNRRLYSKEDLLRILTIKYLKEVKKFNSLAIKTIMEIIDYSKSHELDIKKKFFPDLNEEEELQKSLK